jgi:hypothetical protein
MVNIVRIRDVERIKHGSLYSKIRWRIGLSRVYSYKEAIKCLFGKEENLKIIATIRNAAPKMRYGIFTASNEFTCVEPATAPKMAKLTISGPMVVPKLLIPPARLNR